MLLAQVPILLHINHRAHFSAYVKYMRLNKMKEAALSDYKLMRETHALATSRQNIEREDKRRARPGAAPTSRHMLIC